MLVSECRPGNRRKTTVKCITYDWVRLSLHIHTASLDSLNKVVISMSIHTTVVTVSRCTFSTTRQIQRCSEIRGQIAWTYKGVRRNTAFCSTLMSGLLILPRNYCCSRRSRPLCLDWYSTWFSSVDQLHGIEKVVEISLKRTTWTIRYVFHYAFVPGFSILPTKLLLSRSSQATFAAPITSVSLHNSPNGKIAKISINQVWGVQHVGLDPSFLLLSWRDVDSAHKIMLMYFLTSLI